jgi:hypothetical protein
VLAADITGVMDLRNPPGVPSEGGVGGTPLYSVAGAQSRPSAAGSVQSAGRRSFQGILQHSGVPQLEHPHILGGVVSVTWAAIEPANGIFRWEPIEDALRNWSYYGKRAAIEVLLSETPKVPAVSESWERAITGLAAKTAPTANPALPPWLVSLGLPQAESAPGTVRPHQYWNPVFLSALQRMVNQLGTRFDGRPEVMWVYAAVGCDGRTALEDTTPCQTAGNGPSRAMLWRTIGYSDERWLETVCTILTYYRAAFEVTPTVAKIVHPYLPESGSPALGVEVHEPSQAVSDLLAFVTSQRMWVEYDCRSTDSPPLEPEWRNATMIVNPRKSAAMQGRPLMADLHREVAMGASYALVHATDLSNPRNQSALEWAASGAAY